MLMKAKVAAVLMIASVSLGLASLREPNAVTTDGKTVEQLAKEGYGGRETKWPAHSAMLGKPAPAAAYTEWFNGEVTAEQMKGKIVVVDFWATWCSDCMAAIPKNNELSKRLTDQGVLFFGACGSRNQERMKETAEKQGLKYPTARVSDETIQAWGVNFWPTYVIIDGKGIIRAYGVKQHYIEPIVKKLLEEKNS